MSQRNRGKHPNDEKLFAPKVLPNLRAAISDLSFLLTKGYGEKSALQLVGNRYRLNVRQQKALLRMSDNREAVILRQAKVHIPAQLKGKRIEIDGFNLLILLESAMSGAFIFEGIDGTYKDISSVHGSYKRVTQTERAILLVGEELKKLGAEHVHWIFDAPVSNSGRLKTRLYELATAHGFNWDITLDNNPDALLAKSEGVVISTDAWILDRCAAWTNFGAHLIDSYLSKVTIIHAIENTD